MPERLGVWDGSPVWVVSDIDGTLYTNPDYIRSCSLLEIAEIAGILGVQTDEAGQMILRKRKELSRRIPRELTLTEIVYALGITRSQWSELRCRSWEPEKWLKYDQELCRALEMFCASPNILGICFATNSPVDIGRRTLSALGIRSMPRLVFGPENTGCFKPDPRFFPYIAEYLYVLPAQCISIGDRKMSDGDPAIAAGFCYAFMVEGRDDFIATLRALTYT